MPLQRDHKGHFFSADSSAKTVTKDTPEKPNREPIKVASISEGRYFYADGTKKYYCIKCRKGPYKKTDSLYVTSINSVICTPCKEKYYKVELKKRVPVGRCHNNNEYDPKTYRINEMS